MTKAGIKKKAIAVKDARVNIHQSSERFEDDGIARTSSQERREARNSMSIGCPAHREAKKMPRLANAGRGRVLLGFPYNCGAALVSCGVKFWW
jgi:hypothetical protein